MYVECQLIAVLFWLSQLVTGAANGIVRVRNSTDGTVARHLTKRVRARWRGRRGRRALWRLARSADSASVGAPPVARAARAWARPMAIGEGGASVVGDSAKTACCDNVPLARYFHHFYAIPMRSRVHLRYRTGERRALSYTRLRQWIQCRARA